MVHILGRNLAEDQTVYRELQSFHGIGRVVARNVMDRLTIHPRALVRELDDSQVNKLVKTLSGMCIEGDLRRDVRDRVLLQVQLRTERGLRFVNGLPVNGQRSHCNGRTAQRINPTLFRRAFSVLLR